MPVGPHNDLLTGNIAIDCEMMRSNIGQVLGRVSVVNSGYEGKTIFDTFACYPEPITITKPDKEFPGIELNNIDQKNGALSVPELQDRLVELLRDRFEIGHNIQ